MVLDGVEDAALRRMLAAFCHRVDTLLGPGGSIVAFWLLDGRYVRDAALYPQYIMVLDGELDPAALDSLFLQLQDEYGWPHGHYFANSLARKNILTCNEVRSGVGPRDVFLDAADIDRILSGQYLPLLGRGYPDEVWPEASLRRLRGEIISLEDALRVSSLSESVDAYRSLSAGCRHPGVAVAITDEFPRMRGRSATQTTPVLQRLRDTMAEYVSGGRPHKHLLYGRLNGSGKSQYLYHLMGYLHRLGYPFIYKEPFHFHYSQYTAGVQPRHPRRSLYGVLDGPPKDPQAATGWLTAVAGEITYAGGRPPVLLIDEDELCWSRLADHFTVAADKDPRPFRDEAWQIHDILLEDSPGEEYVAAALGCELQDLGIGGNLLPDRDQFLRAIARHSYLPHYCHLRRPSVFYGKQLMSLGLLSAVQRYLAGEVLRPGSGDVLQWAQHYWSKFVPRRIAGADFHCEYIVFDGEHCRYDPYVKFAPEAIIAANAEAHGGSKPVD